MKYLHQIRCLPSAQIIHEEKIEGKIVHRGSPREITIKNNLRVYVHADLKECVIEVDEELLNQNEVIGTVKNILRETF